jgi:hypothetical protein
MRFWSFLSLCSLMTVAMVSSTPESRSSDFLGPRASRPPAYDGRNYRELTLVRSRAQLTSPGLLHANSLCAKTERIIFSCLTKRSGVKPAVASSKIASLCASLDLDKQRGYLQYRYGRPGKLELEFPSSRTGTQQMFQYTHYMRYQVDLTEINFEIDGYQYQIFDDYNGEEKPRISTEGVSVTAPGKPKEVSFVCRTKAKADYSMLDELLTREQ